MKYIFLMRKARRVMHMEAKYRNKKIIQILCVFLVIAGFLAVSYGRSKKEEKHIVFVVKSIDDTTDFWKAMISGANMAAKEYDVKLTVMGPDSETEYEEQGKMIRKAIGMRPDAIVLTPASYTKTTSYAKEIERAGIELVLADSLMEETFGNCVVATDNIEAGRKMGNYMKEHFPKDCCIGVVGHVKGSSTAIERETGLRDGLGEMKENIEEVVFCDSDYRKAYAVTKEMLQRNPKINVIAGLNEYSSVGAARAVQDLKLDGEIFMVGFDSSLREVEYLEAEIFDAIVVQKPLNMGYLAVENTVKLLQNKEIPQYIDSGSVLITKETMYSPENQKLLFPL